MFLVKSPCYKNLSLNCRDADLFLVVDAARSDVHGIQRFLVPREAAEADRAEDDVHPEDEIRHVKF